MTFYISAVILTLIELAIFKHLHLFLVRPNLILFLITIFSFYFNFDKLKVVLFCLFCGFIKDLFSLAPLGTHMVIFMLLGIILSHISKRFLRYNWIFIIFLFIAASLTAGIIYTLIQNLFFNANLSFFVLFWRILILEILEGIILFFIFLKPIKRCVLDKLS